MIKAVAIRDFTLAKFDELQNIVRKGSNVKGKIFKDDTFECTEELAKYLTGENKDKLTVIKIIEIKPEKEEEPETVETAEQPVTTKKKKNKKRVDF